MDVCRVGWGVRLSVERPECKNESEWTGNDGLKWTKKDG
jgi:hypothetical protein